MAVEGTLDLFQLPEILQVVSQQRKTGILTVQGPDDIVAVSFLEGRIVAADSLTETTEAGIGEVLLAEGQVSQDLLRTLSNRSSQGGPRLGDLLVSEGHVDREDLLEALRTHTVRLLESLLDWSSGQFKFYGGDEVSYEEGFRSIGVDELLLRAIEDQERDALPEPDSVLERTSSDRAYQVRELDSLGGEQVSGEALGGLGDTLWLTPEEERVLDEVVADRPVYEVAQAARVPLDRTRYILFRLAREGLVVRAEPPAGAPVQASPSPDGSFGGLTLDPAIADVPDLTPAPPPGDRSDGAAVPLDAPARMAVSAVEPVPGAADGSAERPSRPSRPTRPTRSGGRSEGAEPGRSLPITGLLALVLVVVVVGAVVFVPASVPRPFPWLAAERAEEASTYDALLLAKIDRAAETYFLLEGRFPDRLQDLVALGLLQSEDLVDAQGRTLSYSAAEGAFQIHPVSVDSVAEEPPGGRETVTGNFLLDPEFLAPVRDQSEEPPLVLLD